ncbi:MAG: CinA family nicotinamide mononucleotide deamidase-related protein [Oscillospiraceae bacterium]|nr:CinA family nicotinamide mononucleotide deamidase-related protein [Oscillospiraceae bacterium]
MRAEIITVSTGLLTGDADNTHSRYIAAQLAACGLPAVMQTTVGGDRVRLAETLELARQRSDLILITGGLADGLTKETVCRFLGIPLSLHEESWERITARYYPDDGDAKPSENDRRQAMIPEGAVVFPNDSGISPGMAIERYDQSYILLPGPAAELIPMFERYAAPYLVKFSGEVFCFATVGIFGMAESAITEQLADLTETGNPVAVCYTGENAVITAGEVRLRITARGTGQGAAQSLCGQTVEEIINRFGGAVYSVDGGSLVERVVALLAGHEMKIATAESCTAGMLSERLTGVAGASAVFECGVAAYSPEIKQNMLGVPGPLLAEQGAVCADVAAAMASGVRQRAGAHIGVGITGVAGPGPSGNIAAGTVFIAVADDKRVWVKELSEAVREQSGETGSAGNLDREQVRRLATSHALDMVRRYIEALPAVLAGGKLLAEESRDTGALKKRRLVFTRHRLKFIRRLLITTGLIMTVFFGWQSFNRYFSAPGQNRTHYDQLKGLYKAGFNTVAGANATVRYPAGMLPAFRELYDLNPDIRGWLTIDGTGIHYPVVQNDDKDYARIDFSGKSSDFGVLYFDAGSLDSADEVNRVLTIQGNSAPDNQMFSPLILYTARDYWLEHPVAVMNTLYEAARWQVFAVMYVEEPGGDGFDYRRGDFTGDEDFAAFIEQLCRRSLYISTVTPEVSDRLLLLATEPLGKNGLKLVVCARRLADGEQQAEEGELLFNPQAILPPGLTAGEATAAYTASAASAAAETTALETSAPPALTDAPTTTVTAATAGTETVRETTETTASAAAPATTAPPTAATAPEPPKTTDPAPPVSGELPVTPYAEQTAYSALKLWINGASYPVTTPEQLQYAVACVVKQELGSAAYMVNSTEAQKAQAVASYSYMLHFCVTQKREFGISKTINLDNANDRKIYQAVGEVLGVKIIHPGAGSLAGSVISTMYFASSNGGTANCQNVFTASLPYLKAVPSPYETESYLSKYGERLTSNYSISFASLKAKLNTYVSNRTGGRAKSVDFDPPASQNGVLVPVYATSYDTFGGYVVSTNCYYTDNGKKIYLRGIDIRGAIGNNTLRSHAFTVDYNQSTDMLTFTAGGYGHGVGLSQMGAVGYANEAGWTYEQILKHYYSITADSAHQICRPRWE